MAASDALHRPCACCLRLFPSKDLKRCGRCKVAHYCGTTCQAAHWPSHRDRCAKLAHTAETCAGAKENRRAAKRLVDAVAAVVRRVRDEQGAPDPGLEAFAALMMAGAATGHVVQFRLSAELLPSEDARAVLLEAVMGRDPRIGISSKPLDDYLTGLRFRMLPEAMDRMRGAKIRCVVTADLPGSDAEGVCHMPLCIGNDA